MKRAELGRLNPEIVNGRVPTLQGRQMVRVPRDRETLAEILLRAGVERPTELDRQVVQRVVAFGRAARAVLPEQRAVASTQTEDAGWERLASALNGSARQTYSVKRGDSLQKISRLFGVDEQRLREANGVKDPRSMPIGMVLVVPSDS
jgi:nucleoid-associated protein YgaU